MSEEELVALQEQIFTLKCQQRFDGVNNKAKIDELQAKIDGAQVTTEK